MSLEKLNAIDHNVLWESKQLPILSMSINYIVEKSNADKSKKFQEQFAFISAQKAPNNGTSLLYT